MRESGARNAASIAGNAEQCADPTGQESTCPYTHTRTVGGLRHSWRATERGRMHTAATHSGQRRTRR